SGGLLRGQVEEQLLETGAVGGPQVVEDDAAGQRSPADVIGLGIDEEARALGGSGDQVGSLESGSQGSLVVRPDEGAPPGEQLGSAALRDDPAEVDNHE